MRIRYTQRARDNLKAIRAYVAQDSVIYARRLVQRIRRSIAMLTRFPEIGSVVEEWGRRDLRELSVGNYRVIYRLTGREILIRSVVHGARLFPDQPDKD